MVFKKEFVCMLAAFLMANAALAQSREVTMPMDRISNFLAAAESSNTAKVAEDLNQGAEINATDEHGQTALMLAADQGRVDTVRLLLQRGAVPDLQNKLGATALMFASFNGHLDVVRELLRLFGNRRKIPQDIAVTKSQ